MVPGKLTIYPLWRYGAGGVDYISPLPYLFFFFVKAALEEERRLVARVVHLMRNDDTDRYFRMLVVARRHLGQVGLLPHIHLLWQSF